MVLDEENKTEIRFINNKFFLGSFRMSFSEKAQITETFGSANLSFFNDTVKIYNFAGQAVDYPSVGEDPHKTMNQSALTRMYNKHLRGTQLVKSKSIMLLKVFNHMVYGYPINFNTSYSAQQDKMSSFSFQMVVTKHTQNLPGLWETQDLEDSYSVGNVIYNEEDSYRISLITEFQDALEENLRVARDLIGTNGIRVDKALPLGVGLFDLRSEISILSGGDPLIEKDLKSHIRRGLNGFLSYVSSTDDSRFSTALGLKDYGPEGENPNSLAVKLSNGAIDTMFDSPASWDLVKEFLSEISYLDGKLMIIKNSIQAKG